MDADTALLPGLTPEEEYMTLQPLIVECLLFETKWNVRTPLMSDASPDAVLAVHALHTRLLERRAYLLETLDKPTLPF